MTFKTLKEAEADGYHEPLADQYGGEWIEVNGQTLVKNPKRALSRAEWHAQGFRPKPGTQPHALLQRRNTYYGRHLTYAVYRDDQVETKR